MNFHPASLLSLIAFVDVLFFVLAMLGAGLYFSAPKLTRRRSTLIGLCLTVLWLGLLGAIIRSGWAEAEPVPRLPILFLGINAVAVVFALSPVGKRFAVEIPIFYLIAFQGFRLPLELILHAWAIQGTIPETMTWTGQNWDFLSGLAAIAGAILYQKNPVWGWLANALGFTLLLNVMRVAVLSSPVSFGWNTQPPLLLAFHLPYALIVPVCVGGALAGHLILTRAFLYKASKHATLATN